MGGSRSTAGPSFPNDFVVKMGAEQAGARGVHFDDLSFDGDCLIAAVTS